MKIFHGTGLANYESILNEKCMRITSKKTHWLGNGVYFFVEDIDRAKWWAESNRPDKSTEPVVIELEIEFNEGELLDLDKSKALTELDTFARQFKTELQRKRIRINNMDESEFQCRLIDVFMSRKAYKAISRTFHASSNVQAGSSMFIPLAKQLSIFEHSIIDTKRMVLHYF